MKLSFALLLPTLVSASLSISGKNAAKVLSAARRLDQEANGDDAAAEDEYGYLTQYNLKMIGCKSGETVINPEDGEYEYNAIVFRLCPSDSGCDSDTSKGCSSGYGDYVVGLNTFVDAYFEDQKDNMQWDDQFQVNEYAQCGEYKVEDAEDDANANQYADYQFWIGPSCTADGDDVRLAVFEDEACTYESEVAFEALSNGWSLPYENGGMVSTYCQDCLEYDDNGDAGLREMCQEVYMNAAASCEEKMEYYSYYGQNVQGCEYVSSLMPAQAKKSGNGGKVFGWIVFFIIVIGLAGYIMWWRSSEWKKKRRSLFRRHSRSSRSERLSSTPAGDENDNQAEQKRRWWKRFLFRRRRRGLR